MKNQPVQTVESAIEEETQKEVDTPEDALLLVTAKVKEEMRVFDVNDHHAILFEQILEKARTLEEDQIRPMIKETVESVMDAYFRSRIGDLLLNYNEYYTASDVETVFNNTSRTALYQLIELYEWTFYKNNR
ncbi:MAG TPA: hypothetical protein DCS67_03605 [Clostridiales bacterium UBA8960]|nr:hypothetical protein [Clostridiales bacterium UBA8960]